MPETLSIRAATLSGGISRQRPEARSPGQVDGADNADFHLAHGLALRSGTTQAIALGSSLASRAWLIKPLLPGGVSPRFVIGSDGSVRAFVGTTEATVLAHRGATNYLFGTHDRRPYVAGGTTIEPVVRIVNPSVVPAVVPSLATIKTEGEHTDFDALSGVTADKPGAYRRVLEDGAIATRPAGLYRYTPGGSTPSVLKSGKVNSGAVAFKDYINASTTNPQGAKFRFGELYLNVTGAAYVAATKTLTIAGGFVNWTFVPGRKLFVSGPVGVTAGAWEIASKVDDNTITLVTNPTGATTSLDVRGIGIEVEVRKDYTIDPVSSPEQWAKTIQRALRDGGATNACVWWEPEPLNAATQGYLHVSNHFSGPLAGFPSTEAVVAPGSGFSWLSANWPFASMTPNNIPGRGNASPLVPEDRWTAVAQPNQNDAIFDPYTMPMLIRQVVTGTVDDTIARLRPSAWWRLTDKAGSYVMDAAGVLMGSCQGGLVAAGNSLLAFDGVNDSITLPSGVEYRDVYSQIGNYRNNSMTVVANVKSTAGNPGDVIDLVNVFRLRVNYNAATASTSNNIVSVKVGSTWWTSGTVTNLNAAGGHIIAVSVVFGTSVTLYVDGVKYTMTAVGSVTNPDTTTFSGSIGGGTGLNYFAGSLANIFILPTSISDSVATWLYLMFNLDIAGPGVPIPGPMYAVEPERWLPRTSGDSRDNPVPSFVTNQTGITAINEWQGRVVFGAGTTITASRTGEPNALFVQNVASVGDNAPIDRVIASTGGATQITDLTVFGSICFATTNGRQQYEISGRPLTVSSINARAGINREMVQTSPALSGDRMFAVAYLASSVGSASLIEVSLDEQAVQAVSEDVGQHVQGLIASINLDAVSVPTDGKVMLAARGTGTIYVYQTAYVGNEKRQSAWGIFTLSGATILSACASDSGADFLVNRSGKYLIEHWEPEHPDLFPAGAIRLDGRFAISGGTYSGGLTTYTMPTNVPATGIDTVVAGDGTAYPATAISATQFTIASDTSALTVTAGRSYGLSATPSRPFSRDLNGQAYVGTDLVHAYTIATTTDPSRVFASVRQDTRQPTTYPFRPLAHEPDRCRAWTRGPVGRTIITLTASGPAPIAIGTIEQVMDHTPSRT